MIALHGDQVSSGNNGEETMLITYILLLSVMTLVEITFSNWPE
jgi:hypothetical protein